MFSLSLFSIQSFQKGSKVFDLVSEGERSSLFFPQRPLQIFHLPQDFAQLALHRQRSLSALFATSHGDIVKALSTLREEKRVGIFERQTSRHADLGNDISIAQFRQDHFQ